MPSNFRAVIPWETLESFLKKRLEQLQERYIDEDDPQESNRLKGRAREIKALLNLPETLAALEQEDEKEKANGNRNSQNRN